MKKQMRKSKKRNSAETDIAPDTHNFGNWGASSDRKIPPFYVVTVNYHNENQIIRMIKSLRSVNIVKKLIIVDHSGSDSLNSINSDFPMLVIRQPNRGYGAGLNRGLRQIPDRRPW